MITLRKANLNDAIHLYVWRTHPTTRVMMRDTEHFTWEAHLNWLRDVMEDPDRHLLIGLYGTTPIGTARLDVEGNQAEISVTVAPECRGGGKGAQLIAMATKWGMKHGLTTVIARVKPENVASIKAFTKAGYGETERNPNEVTLLGRR
jgi:RimJ/RimL family protein N-acetyltransferase